MHRRELRVDDVSANERDRPSDRDFGTAAIVLSIQRVSACHSLIRAGIANPRIWLEVTIALSVCAEQER